jgi:hypothetical protein
LAAWPCSCACSWRRSRSWRRMCSPQETSLKPVAVCINSLFFLASYILQAAQSDEGYMSCLGAGASRHVPIHRGDSSYSLQDWMASPCRWWLWFRLSCRARTSSLDAQRQ